MHQHLVRFGSLGHVGRFTSAEPIVYARSARVICRTPRGLEVGEVLAPLDRPDPPGDGLLVRKVTVEDDLLLSRLERHREEAYEACTTMLAERGLDVVLMDVEHLFDGQSLIFYFLGDVTPELERLTAELAETYETKVQFRRFTESVVNGCGPGCGTDDAPGCSTSGCASCVVAAACKHSAK